MSETDTELAATIAKIITVEDLALFSTKERIGYYNRVCQALGLNPLTRPFAYITLNGRLQLYALKEASEQLRMIHGVSVEKVERDVQDDVVYVTVVARNRAGRTDSDVGAVGLTYPDRHYDEVSRRWTDNPKAGTPLSPEDKANAIMKAVTKAKRRVTLSICGLSMLDESEIDSVRGASPVVVDDQEPVANPPETAAVQAAAAVLAEPAAREAVFDVVVALVGDDEVPASIVADVRKFCDRLRLTKAFNGALDYVTRQYQGKEQLYATQRICALRDELTSGEQPKAA